MQILPVTTALVLVLVTAYATDARAQVVFEEYSGARPAEAGPIMEVLRRELGENHAVALPDNVADSMFYAPKPAITDPNLTSEALVEELELSVKSYLKVKYDIALLQFTSALAHADTNYGLVVSDAKVKGAMSRAQIALALTYKKLAELKVVTSDLGPLDVKKDLEAKKALEAKAAEAMATYIRSSRDPVVRRMFGPPGEELYNEVRKTLDPVQRANLAININEADAQTFVNGLSTGRGATFAAALLPGPGCIIVQVGRRMLRYDVTLSADQPIVLDINWALDTVLNISEHWVGLMLPNDTTEATYVPSLARRMGGQLTIIFVGLRRERGALTVYGYHYDHAAQGHLGWSGEVHIGGVHDEAKLRDFARFIVKGIPSAAIVPVGTIESAPSHGSWLTPATWSLGGGLIAMAAGIGLNEVSAPYGGSDKAHIDPQVIGIAMAVGGSVAVGGGVYLWMRRVDAASPRTSALLGGGVAMLSMGAVLYLADDQPSTDGVRRPLYIGSAPYGIAIGVAGLAATGAGLWLWHRGLQPVPIVSASHGGGTISWAGRF